MKLDKAYWQQRYLENNIPWDAGKPTPPIVEFADSLPDKSIDILIPGAGNAHEAGYLFEKGFKNIWICDWVPEALTGFSVSYPAFPSSQLLAMDFFDIPQSFDLILEQTFFCALAPEMRTVYVAKTAALLRDEGRLAGVLFANPFQHEGPPFGGTKDEYLHLFSPKFRIEKLELCYNSIPPRKDNELFINFVKKAL